MARDFEDKPFQIESLSKPNHILVVAHNDINPISQVRIAPKDNSSHFWRYDKTNQIIVSDSGRSISEMLKFVNDGNFSSQIIMNNQN